MTVKTHARILRDQFQAKQIETLRANAKAGLSLRYIVRCGLEANGKIQVHDCFGGWVCSTHKSLALAQKRADELNAKVACH